MLFDWFTVFAQIANFLILMWLLKRFLYKPVLDAIDAREKRIADLLAETQQNQKQVEQQQADLTHKNADFSSERDDLLLQAKTEATSLKQQMLDTASREVAEQRSQWLERLQKEQQNLDHDIGQRTQQEVFHVARKALQDLSGVELETQITQVFIKQLEQLSPEQRHQFSTSTQDGVVIRSAMVLSDENKQALRQAVEQAIAADVSLRFEVGAQLVSGIEMIGSGHKLSWNIDDYLSGLEESLSSLVESKVVQNARQSSVKGASDV